MKTGRKLSLIAAAAVLVLLGAGISYAWFSQRAALSTLMDILPPDSIEIYPVDADGGEMGMLDLDFKEPTEGDDEIYDEKTTDEEGNTTITIRRPVKIYSTSPVHQLEIVHTTNLNMLTFNIYPAIAVKSENDENQIVSFSYDKNKLLSGKYKNETSEGSGQAKEEVLKNYQSTDDVANTHAYPLYWLAENSGDSHFVDDTDKSKIVTTVTSESENKIDPSKQVEKTYYTTYYILEISWQENSKETDLFYIMARNIDVAEKSEGSVSKP